MTTQTRVYQQPTASMMASAETHLELRNDPAERWATVHIGGERYIVLTSGTSGRRHIVRADGRACDCRWYQKTWTQCSHGLAVYLAALEDDLRQTAAVACYEDYWPACAAGCGDLVDRTGETCYACSSDRAYAERIAAKRAVGR